MSTNEIRELPTMNQLRLEKVILNDNKINNLEGFEGNDCRIMVLELERNKIKNLSGISHMQHLKTLLLGEN